MKHKILQVFWLGMFIIMTTSVWAQSNGKASDEIMNTFLMLDESIKESNEIVEASVFDLIASMEETAKTKKQYQELVEKAKEVKNLTVEFNTFVDGLRERMVKESGGAYTIEEANERGYPELAGKPRGKKDKNTPQRIFLSGKYGSAGKREPQGIVLAIEMKKLEVAYLVLVSKLWDNGGIRGTIFADESKKTEALTRLESELALEGYGDYEPENHRGKSWEEFTFGHLPVAAVYPILRKFQNDARTSEAAVINFLAKQMGRIELNYNKFDVISQASKPYILLGETYETEIALGAYSSQADFSVSVNGSRLKIIDGKATYLATGSSVGEKKYTATISVKNPMTGEIETFKKDFFYEVGQPAVNVSADKMNVLYLGVDNPITVAAAGMTSSKIKVVMPDTDGSLVANGSNSYIATVTKLGKATIMVRDLRTGKSYPFQFRVKRVPDPIVTLGGKDDGLIGADDFKAQAGLVAMLKNFDFEAKCTIQSYTMWYTPKGQDAIEVQGREGRFSNEILSIIKQAKSGDQYFFTDMRVRCSGDTASRRVNGLAFIIK